LFKKKKKVKEKETSVTFWLNKLEYSKYPDLKATLKKPSILFTPVLIEVPSSLKGEGKVDNRFCTDGGKHWTQNDTIFLVYLISNMRQPFWLPQWKRNYLLEMSISSH